MDCSVTSCQKEKAMLARLISALFGGSIRLCSHGVVTRSDVGRQRWVIRVKSAYSIGETVERLKKDIADKVSNRMLRRKSYDAPSENSDRSSQAATTIRPRSALGDVNGSILPEPVEMSDRSSHPRPTVACRTLTEELSHGQKALELT
jgi:hypothetical protein